jgi:hypothetical protein
MAVLKVLDIDQQIKTLTLFTTLYSPIYIVILLNIDAISLSFGLSKIPSLSDDFFLVHNHYDAPPHSLKDSNASPKVKTVDKRIGIRSVARNILGVEGRAETPRWGLGRVTSESIIHTDLHSPNNKLVSAWLEHFWCTNEPWAYTNSQNSPRPEL